jgi:hypothetical protein
VATYGVPVIRVPNFGQSLPSLPVLHVIEPITALPSQWRKHPGSRRYEA